MTRDDVDFNARLVKDDCAGLALDRRNFACGQIAKILLMGCRTEARDTRYCEAGVAPRSQSFHQQPVGFVAAAVRRIVERVLRQQNAHSTPLRRNGLSGADPLQ